MKNDNITNKAIKVVNRYQRKRFSFANGYLISGIIGFLLMGFFWVIFG